MAAVEEGGNSPEERPEGSSALSRCAGFKNGGQKQQEDGLKATKAVEEETFNCLVNHGSQKKLNNFRASLFIRLPILIIPIHCLT